MNVWQELRRNREIYEALQEGGGEAAKAPAGGLLPVSRRAPAKDAGARPDPTLPLPPARAGAVPSPVAGPGKRADDSPAVPGAKASPVPSPAFSLARPPVETPQAVDIPRPAGPVPGGATPHYPAAEHLPAPAPETDWLQALLERTETDARLQPQLWGETE